VVKTLKNLPLFDGLVVGDYAGGSRMKSALQFNKSRHQAMKHCIAIARNPKKGDYNILVTVITELVMRFLGLW
jgi:hypothetical protein